MLENIWNVFTFFNLSTTIDLMKSILCNYQLATLLYAFLESKKYLYSMLSKYISIKRGVLKNRVKIYLQ